MRVSGVPVITPFPCDTIPQPIEKLRAVLPRQKKKTYIKGQQQQQQREDKK